MTEWDRIVGHGWAVEHLRQALQSDRLGHAILITGPEQVGKTLLARTIAQALNCLEIEPSERPCGRCRACKLIAADRHPDVRLLEPEITGRGKLQIRIDTIRELAQELTLAPYEARRRIAILRRFDAANPNAANAFLKTLEEPPDKVLLILTALDATSLLPTIASRCRELPLRPLAADQVQEALVNRWRADPTQARLLAHFADGRLGLAVQALSEPGQLEERQTALEALDAVLAADLVERFALADKLARDAEALPDLLRAWISWWRDLALIAWDEPAILVNLARRDQLTRLAGRWPQAQIVAALERTLRAVSKLEANANTRLVMEVLLLDYPHTIVPNSQERSAS
jgi:DNA polymerase-3 subunit delta'